MLLTNLRLVLPSELIERGWLQIQGGRIAALGAGAAPLSAGRAVDGAGLTAIPGMIDLHGDMLEREVEPRPSASFPTDMAVHELDKRLAAAGITVAYAALSFWDHDGQESVRKLALVREMVEEIHRLRPHLLTDLRVHARFEVATPSVAPMLGELIESGQIELLSLMDHTPGQGQYRDLERYVSSMAEWRRIHRDHVEEELRERLERAGSVEERWALARDIAMLAAELGLPIASHDDDTAAKVDLVAALGATLAEFPVTIEAAEEARRRGMHVAMGAPNALRGVSHSGNLSAREALSAGLVDCLAADYHPGTLVQAVFGLAREGVVSLPQAVALVTSGPAAVIRMEDAGRIAPGMRADLCLIEDVPRPRVRGTLRGGTPIYWDQTMWARTL
jgi:alpha-D-ribose 1-methylphosphonate 5-triphosphate diphosphatase